jgi:hypothetical protein
MKFVLIWWSVVSGLCFSNALMSEEVSLDSRAFPVGEELEYSMKWGVFKVGTGYLRVLPDVDIEGVECFHFELVVQTNSFADVIYQVRSRFQSFVSKSDFRVMRYRIEQHEGNTHREATVSFDWEAMTAVYHRDGEDPKEPIAIAPQTWDPLSILYCFRSLEIGEETEVVLPATDGKKLFTIDIRLLERTRFKSQMGDNPAIKVEPDTKEMKGVFKKSKKSKIRIWFSEDDAKLPLLIRSKVIVGSFDAELKARRLK